MDINKQEIVSVENINTGDFYQNDLASFTIPFQQHGTIFNKQGHIYYIAQGSFINDLSNKRSYIIELTAQGEFVPSNENKRLDIRESLASNTPDDYQLLFDVFAGLEIAKVNILSLDNFPIINIDNGNISNVEGR